MSLLFHIVPALFFTQADLIKYCTGKWAGLRNYETDLLSDLPEVVPSGFHGCCNFYTRCKLTIIIHLILSYRLNMSSYYRINQVT